MSKKVSASARNWVLRTRDMGDAMRGELTAAKLKLWLKCWELISYKWITTTDLAKTLGVHDRQLRRCLHRFEAAGLIEWERGGIVLGNEVTPGRVRQKAELQ